LEVIEENRLRRLHTLVYLDIQDGRYMTVNEGICLLERMTEKKQVTIPLYIGIARAGSAAPVVRAGTANDLCSVDFGPPLHVLIVPGDLHDMEQLYLKRFARLC
jgi:diphthine synthase